jgi:NADPH:quinone reductase
VISVSPNGEISVATRHVYPLRDAARAHADIEARKTSGSVVLRTTAP